MPFFAHSKNDDGQGVPEALSKHLQRVAERAVRYASNFGASDQARVAGLLHDVGKYTEQFQRRLRDPRGVPARDHSSAGAFLAATCYKRFGTLPALAVQGHHGGLRTLVGWKTLAENIARAIQSDASGERLTGTDLTSVKALFEADGFTFPRVNEGLIASDEFAAADMLDVRILFSALVDADFVETEAHFAGDSTEPRRYRAEGTPLNAVHALAATQAYIEAIRERAEADPEIRQVRDALLDSCLSAAERPAGLFTLSAPTGSGKTLAMLAFALRHAVQHGLQRIVLIMPFLNIIDQTAQVYREVFCEANGFPAHFVIEDHSNVQPPCGREEYSTDDAVEEHKRIDRLLAENWDAPIVLTTSIQCLESLMSSRPSACRKLHRLARSILLFDEVQTLPPHLAAVTLATLSRLSERFGTTVVFATATQPAFSHLHEHVRKLSQGGWEVTEIVSDPQTLFASAAKRVRVSWRHCDEKSWEVLGDELRQYDNVLCVVNLKRHARRLAEFLRDREVSGLFHLSTSMCPAHRRKVLEQVDEGLRNPQRSDHPVRLISTQCVEAGVDLDFPVIYRALAPLEAIAQAAGRCNRNGRGRQRGEVYVFRPAPDGSVLYPPGAYKQAADTTETYLNALTAADSVDLDKLEILNDPDRLRQYYEHLYTLTGMTESSRELNHALSAGNFEEVARLYRLIDQNTINILVPYDEQEFEHLRKEIEETDPLTPGFIRDWIRRARPHAVSIYRSKPTDALWAHVTPIQFSRRYERGDEESSWFIALPGARYDRDLLGWLPSDDSFVV